MKDDRQLAAAFYADYGVEYPSLFDPRGEVALAFRGFPANAVPSTILIDAQGRVAAVYTAAVAGDDLRSALSSLLAESWAGSVLSSPLRSPTDPCGWPWPLQRWWA